MLRLGGSLARRVAPGVWNRASHRIVSVRSFCSAGDADILNSPREAVEYDVVIVGGGPAGLSAAIRLKQLCKQNDRDLNVCVVEKGHEIGAHILSGNVFEPHALNELIPDWKEKGAPLDTPAKEDRFYYLTSKEGAFRVPTIPLLHNEGNYIISLGKLTRWLGQQAEELGVDIFPATPASEVLYGDSGQVVGVATSDAGIGKDGKPKDSFVRGMELKARVTLLAEGCRGSCSESVMKKFKLREGKDPQRYGLGIKEVWQIPQERCKPGLIQHTLGWPLSRECYGGTFLYHMAPNYVLLGFVIGLDYPNPYINPYMEFQQLKHHQVIKRHLEGGECVQYGARCINEGGFQAIPKLTFPGGGLIGCSAGFVNVPKIKGTHTAMKSGMLAAEATFNSLKDDTVKTGDISSYQNALENSWVWKELKSVRNYQPSFHYGHYFGIMYSGLSGFLLKGREPWTFRNKAGITDSMSTRPASEYKPIEYPKPDGVLSFDLLTNLARSGTNHEGDQPPHLRIKPEKAHVPSQVSYAKYAAPESRFCPAKVYEYPEGDKLVINAQNCVHCKCCSIKTPEEFINWTVPESGGGGPAYEIM